jgi:hypothetical protein
MPWLARLGSLVALAIVLTLLVISAFQNSWLTAFWLLFVLALVLLILFLVLRFWAFAVAVALFAVIMLALAVIDTSVTGGNDNLNPSDGNSQSTQPSQPAGNTPTANQKTLTRLTVNYRNPGYDCARVVRAAGHKVVNGIYVYDVGVRHAVNRGNSSSRQWSDALSVPLPGATPAAKRHNLQVAICLDPYIGNAWAHALGTLSVSGHSVLSMNPWLRSSANVTKVNDQAKRFGATLDPRSMGLSAKSARHYVAVNRAWQKRASAIDELLAQFDPTAIRALPSVRNWHAIPLSGTLPEVGLNPRQESLPALVLNVTQKGACAPLLSVGANVGDMRPEVFQTPTCKSTPHGTPPGNGGCTGTQCGHQPPGCTTNCGHTPPGCTHNCTPPHHCVCIHPNQVSQSPLPPPSQPSNVPTHEPSAQPTNPVDTNSPGAPNTGGNNGGSTNNPVPSGPTGTGDPSAPPSSVPTPN